MAKLSKAQENGLNFLHELAQRQNTNEITFWARRRTLTLQTTLALEKMGYIELVKQKISPFDALVLTVKIL